MQTPKHACWILRKIFDARKSVTGNSPLPTILHSLSDLGGFSIKKGYVSMMPQYPKANWSKLVLDKWLIPRHHLIIWMALHNRLSTVDIVTKWGISVQSDCVLCNTQLEETFEHLFCTCQYSNYVWSTLLTWLGYNRLVREWDQKVLWLNQRMSSNKPRACILGLSFAAAIYQI
ncbi:uncharacterized protein LOC132062072 [Lycium ferocissimum]|uniref:uncharacterized protein LOC132062072 n=1 Tax=Lycium ferocissimum TaxID=112874 RepID=UPI0028153EE0|nr:uncharacterized protein LOC132062072 [Lycium ferocissimum]